MARPNEFMLQFCSDKGGCFYQHKITLFSTAHTQILPCLTKTPMSVWERDFLPPLGSESQWTQHAWMCVNHKDRQILYSFSQVFANLLFSTKAFLQTNGPWKAQQENCHMAYDIQLCLETFFFYFKISLHNNLITSCLSIINLITG